MSRSYADAKKAVQDAGLIDENDGHPDIHYRKIAKLLAERDLLREEVKRLREQVKKWEDDWIRMANYISHHDKEMYEAIDEDIGWED